MSRLAVAMLASALALPAVAAPENYTLDPFHTYPNFMVEHWGLSMMYGRFNKSSGKFSVDRAAKTGSVDLVIDTTSIDTGDQVKGDRPRSRDEHLRAADFFNVAEFPRATFKSTKVNFTGDLPSSVEGNFTLLGVTKPVTLTFERFKCGTNPFNKKDRCGGNATGKIKRSDFGMKTAIPAVGDEITLMVEFEGDKD
ncbi:MAG: YceI family protein [Burkholderiales bacterium]|jgi:polyisoprenoid-binding protein YceI|nr:YceI family protein [Burkholderiales bacterium]